MSEGRRDTQKVILMFDLFFFLVHREILPEFEIFTLKGKLVLERNVMSVFLREEKGLGFVSRSRRSKDGG